MPSLAVARTMPALIFFMQRPDTRHVVPECTVCYHAFKKRAVFAGSEGTCYWPTSDVAGYTATVSCCRPCPFLRLAFRKRGPGHAHDALRAGEAPRARAAPARRARAAPPAAAGPRRRAARAAPGARRARHAFCKMLMTPAAAAAAAARRHAARRRRLMHARFCSCVMRVRCWLRGARWCFCAKRRFSLLLSMGDQLLATATHRQRR